MKRFFYYTLALCLTLFMFSCASEHEEPTPSPTIAKRTVIAYMCADNNLDGYLALDITEMIKGSEKLSDDCNLIAFVDREGSKPYILEISNGSSKIVRTYDNEFYSVSPDEMLKVYQWIIAKYPAMQYATILGGHGSGSIISTDTIQTDMRSARSYGYDRFGETSGIRWMNIPSMAKVFSHLPKMDFIFFDCCSMQTAEVAYELRKETDYIISPASETHVSGAPYGNIVPLLNMDKHSIGKAIIDSYAKNGFFGVSLGVCLSVIKTSEMENLLTATRKALETLYDGENRLEIPTDHTIYYFSGYETNTQPILHDMKAVMKKNLTDDAFAEWQQQLDKTVVAKVRPEPSGTQDLWTTSKGPGAPNINFYTFIDTFDDEHYGGISMIVPNKYYDGSTGRGYTSMNTLMYKLLWTNAIGWKGFGW